LANIASNYLIAGQEASRHGTAHPSVVPYQVFPCKDGFLMIGAGNNKQVSWGYPSVAHVADIIFCKFKILAEKVLNNSSLVEDPKFATNQARVENRTELIQIITDGLMQHSRDHWLKRFTGLGFVSANEFQTLQCLNTFQSTIWAHQ
jgi:succinate--hydroxymethylglutarate CoA-transferase